MIPTIPTLTGPQWYCIHNVETGEALFFDSDAEAFRHMALQDIGPASPRFTVHEADTVLVDREKACPSTVFGAMQCGHWRWALSRMLVYGVLAASALFGLWQIGQAALDGQKCRDVQAFILPQEQ